MQKTNTQDFNYGVLNGGMAFLMRDLSNENIQALIALTAPANTASGSNIRDNYQTERASSVSDDFFHILDFTHKESLKYSNFLGELESLQKTLKWCSFGKNIEKLYTDTFDNYYKIFAESKIKNALEDSKWEFRTIKGISREVGIPELLVEEYIDNNKSTIRCSLLRSSNGDKLYRLKSRGFSFKEQISIIFSFISTGD